MSNQLQITGGAKVRALEGVITGTSGVLSSVPLGAANGVATLDSGGKVPVSQLPSSVVTYLGTWNAATNTPTLVNGTGDAGDLYLCNVAGTVNFGAGPIVFVVGDWVLYGSGTWQKSSGQNGTVTSVAASITGNSLGITGSPITTAGTLAFAFAGTNSQYINGAGNLTTFPTLITSIGLSMPSAFSVANSPLTANGSINVTGAGTTGQYIRGDGSLATYNPGSGGGGSSQTFYFNGSVASSVVGYEQMSTTANTGTSTDFSISADGYIASFLTDAGSPNQLNIPAGNWNFEIYMNSSSSGGSPSFYVELYKYASSTFTLIATSSANPEYITNGTAVDLYTTALAVPATVLTVTDRLAVRVYVTHSSKTITMHTQDSNLSSVITTFSTGITALNGLTAQVQYFATGTSGTDFNISSATATHTFNIPSASDTNRGLVTTGTQTFAGAKTFTGNIIADGSVLLKNNVTSFLAGYVNLGGIVTGNGFSVGLPNGGSPLINELRFNSAAAYNYTFPSASGTLALTSSLASYVPYTGATTDVNLGIYSITGGIGTFTNGVLNGNGTNPANLYLKKGSSPFFTNSANYGIIAAVSSSFILISDVDGTNYKYASFNLGSLTNNTNRAYTLPDASGTLALTSQLTSGTVTSVAMTVPTGLSIAGSPITSSGTLAVTFASGYSIPTNASQTNWDTAYTNRITSATSPLSITSNVISISQATTSTNGYLSSTDWNTFNGKQSALTNPVTGTGITNYLPKFTGTSTIGNSILQDDGTNVSIGYTTNPSLYKLDVNGTGRFTNTLTTTGATNPLIIKGTNASTEWTEYYYNTSTLAGYIGNGSGILSGANASDFIVRSEADLVVATGNNRRLTIASTGAATFSSSVSATKVILSGGADQSELTNAVNNDFKLTNSGNFRIVNNANTVAILTAKNNGSVGIGESPTNGKLEVQQTATTAGLWVQTGGTSLSYTIADFRTGTNAQALTLYGNGTAFFGGFIGMGNSSPTVQLDITGIDNGGTSLFAKVFSNNRTVWTGIGYQRLETNGDLSLVAGGDTYFRSGGSERMHITSGGNVLIGTTTDESYKLYVNGGSSNGMLFYTTSAANQLKAAGTAPAITFSNTITSPTIGGALGSCTQTNNFLSGTAAGDMVLINQFSGNRLYIASYSGGVYLTSGATSWTANSDIRLKNINSHIENAVEKLSSLQTINFSYKDDKFKKQNLGLIAQEVEKIFPELIDKNGDGMLGVRYTELVPVLIKAIQELKLEIEILKNK